MSNSDRYMVQSVVKALSILETFVKEEGRELSLAEITSLVGEHKAVTHRLVTTLYAHGFLDRDPITKRFSIGPRAFVIGSYYKQHRELEPVVVPVLREITRKYGHSGYVAVLDGDECLFTNTVEGWHPVRTSAKPGDRRPVYATAVGKVILSCMPMDEVKQILGRIELRKVSPHTITDIDQLLEEIRVARETGYAICRQEMWEGISAVGVPVRDASGGVLAAISVSFPSSIANDEQIKELAEAMRTLSTRASRALEGTGKVQRSRTAD